MLFIFDRVSVVSIFILICVFVVIQGSVARNIASNTIAMHGTSAGDKKQEDNMTKRRTGEQDHKRT